MQVRNLGDLPAVFQVVLRSRGDELVFDPPQGTLNLDPGQLGSFPFTALPRRQSLLAGSKQYEYLARAVSQGGIHQTGRGLLVENGLLTPWVILLVAALCLLSVVVVALVGGFSWLGSLF